MQYNIIINKSNIRVNTTRMRQKNQRAHNKATNDRRNKGLKSNSR